MRVIVIGLVAAAAVAVGCSDSDVGGGEAASGDGGSGDATVEEFCEEMSTLSERFGPDESVEALQSLDPPADIAEDWELVVDTLADLQDAPDAGGASEDATAADQRVTAYLDENCTATVDPAG